MDNHGAAVENAVLSMYNRSIEDAASKLRAAWQLDDLPFAEAFFKKFTKSLTDKLQMHFSESWCAMEMTDAVNYLLAQVEDAKSKGLTNRDNRPWPRSPVEETRADRIEMLRAKIEVARRGVLKPQKQLAQKYKNCAKLRQNLETTQKRRMDCMKYMVDARKHAEDLCQMGVDASSKIFDDELAVFDEPDPNI